MKTYQTIKCSNCNKIHKVNMCLTDNPQTTMYIDHMERELMKYNEQCCDKMNLILSDIKEK